MPKKQETRPTDISFRSVPCINVQDILTSIAYYCQKLGFTKEWEYVDETGKMTMAGLHRDGIEVFVEEKNDSYDFGMQLYLELDPTNMLSALYEEFQAMGANILEPPKMRSWGWTVMLVTDPDGNILRFCGDERADLKPRNP